MFTGIVEAHSRVEACILKKKGAELAVAKPKNFGHPKKGSSVAVNGVCLTVIRADAKKIHFEVVSETLKRSNLGSLRVGSQVNLERALQAKSRIEGHFVLGHVDGVGIVREKHKEGLGVGLRIEYPKALSAFVLEKGSIAINGVSLTLGKVKAGSFWIHVIPHTLKTTGMGAYQAGDKVNLEADILLKFLHRLMIS